MSDAKASPAPGARVPSFQDFAGQSAHIAALQSDFRRGEMVHAYLFTGPRGTGKRSVAQLCAMTAVCRGGENRPCGVCGPCRRVLAGTHPDVLTVLPQQDRKTIGVDAVRDVLSQTDVRAFEDGAKAVLFPRADCMTVQAQNCLLKTLEEPPDGTVFFLCTDQPGALLPTVISRCRVVRFHPLTDEDVERRLIALGFSREEAHARALTAGGCVGQALEIDETMMQLRQTLTRQVFSIKSPTDVLTLVNDYKEDKERQTLVLDVLESAVRELLIAQATGTEIASFDAPQMAAYARAVPMERTLALQREIMTARQMLSSNVSFASAFERILLNISEDHHQWPW